MHMEVSLQLLQIDFPILSFLKHFLKFSPSCLNSDSALVTRKFNDETCRKNLNHREITRDELRRHFTCLTYLTLGRLNKIRYRQLARFVEETVRVKYSYFSLMLNSNKAYRYTGQNQYSRKKNNLTNYLFVIFH